MYSISLVEGTAGVVQPGDVGPSRDFVEAEEEGPVSVQAHQGHHQAQHAQHQTNRHHVSRPAHTVLNKQPVDVYYTGATEAIYGR